MQHQSLFPSKFWLVFVMNLEIREVSDAAEWDGLLAMFPQAHPLQAWTWGVFKSRWGWSARRVVFYAAGNGDVVAAAQLLRRPVPYTPFGILYVPKGPIFAYENAELQQAIVMKLEEMAKKEWAIFLKIDPDIVQGWGPDEELIEVETAGREMGRLLERRGWLFSDDQIQFRNTVTLDIKRSEEEILAAMQSKTRYNIRYAGRKDVVVRRGTSADFKLIYDLYAETAERDGFLIRPEAYYLDGWTAMYEAGMAVPLIAEFEGMPLGAVVIVKFNEVALYMYGASTDRERNRQPNYLLQWEAIKWAKEQGCLLYDFWGAPDEFVEEDSMWGVWRFKKGFNGDVARHIGAWDFPARPMLYKLYTQLLPQYMTFLKRIRN